MNDKQRKAFRIHADDNVAVLLEDCDGGGVDIVGAGGDRRVNLTAPAKAGHKIALRSIEAGAAVVKYGVRIGHATRRIEPGAWVHLHNCASDFDERSSTLDAETGAPTDTPYE